MKRILLNFSILLGFVVVSCDNADLSQEQTAKNDNSLMQRQSSMFSYIESTQINNGVDCENNILIFPTWEKYWETIEVLDQMIENDCNSFDATVPNSITDDQYDALADAAGFDEDNVLRKFEEDLAFCSLRRKIEILENDWLDQQGDGQWDINADPDNHFIDDETERTLLSQNVEVIIGDKKNGYVYYKFIDDEGSWIEVHNNDTQAISQVSQGIIPTNNSNVVVVKPKEENNSGTCKSKVKEVAYEVSGSDRLKRISKIRRESGIKFSSTGNVSTSIFKSKIKAKTKGYRKKNGKWRCRRTWITAGLDVYDIYSTGNGFDTCNDAIEINKFKEKRRRRVKVKRKIDTFVGVLSDIHYFTVQNDKLFSFHKKGNLIINKDFYDMPIN